MEIIGDAEHVEINSDLMSHYSHIMSGNYSSGRFMSANKKEVGFLSRGEEEISQFHQGAGEDALLDLMQLLQSIPEQALLIIDEVETSFHPKAQRRLIRFLTELVRKKKLQVILSTHSPYILDELPAEGRILIQKLYDGRRDIQYGISTNYAMGMIDDENIPDLYVYVEDKESKILLSEIIKTRDANVFSRIDIKEVGDVSVVKALGKLCRNNKLPNKGVAVLDGDANRDTNGNCLYLPSNKAPEKLVFFDMKEKQWCNLDGRFGLGAGNLFSIFDDALTSTNHHEFASHIGDKIRMSKHTVWQYFAEEWCKQCLNIADADGLIEAIKEKLS